MELVKLVDTGSWAETTGIHREGAWGFCLGLWTRFPYPRSEVPAPLDGVQLERFVAEQNAWWGHVRIPLFRNDKMPLYEMLCITTHVPQYQHIRELVRQSSMHVMSSGGVVRRINSWGTRTLPQRMKRHGTLQSIGDYWTLHFDASPKTLRSLNGIMRRDPRVLRWTVLKLADKVEDISLKGQKIPVNNQPSSLADILD